MGIARSIGEVNSGPVIPISSSIITAHGPFVTCNIYIISRYKNGSGDGSSGPARKQGGNAVRPDGGSGVVADILISGNIDITLGCKDGIGRRAAIRGVLAEINGIPVLPINGEGDGYAGGLKAGDIYIASGNADRSRSGISEGANARGADQPVCQIDPRSVLPVTGMIVGIISAPATYTSVPATAIELT